MSSSTPMECESCEPGDSIEPNTQTSIEPGSNSAPIRAPRSLKTIALNGKETGLWKGIQGTGCSSMLESIIFSLFYADTFDNFLAGGGTAKPQDSIKSILHTMAISMRSFPYCCPELYTHYIANLIGLQLCNIRSKDPKFLITRIFEALGHEKNNFNQFSNSTSSSFFHEILIGPRDPELEAQELDDLLRIKHTNSYSMIKLRNIGAPLFMVVIDRLLNSRIQIFPSFELKRFSNCVQRSTNEPLELVGIICAPDHIKAHCYTAFIRFQNAGRNKWIWHSSEGITSTTSDGTILPEVRELENFEQELHQYSTTGWPANLSYEITYIFQYGITYLYYDRNDSRILGGDKRAPSPLYPQKDLETMKRNSETDFLPPSNISNSTSPKYNADYARGISSKALEHFKVKPSSSIEVAWSENLDRHDTATANEPLKDTNMGELSSPDSVPSIGVRIDYGIPFTKDSKLNSGPSVSNTSINGDINIDGHEGNNDISDRGTDGFFPLTSLAFGKGVGIQQRDNSCYVDTTLFCLFYSSNLFDPLLKGGNRAESTTSDKALAKIYQKNALKSLKEIVGILRKKYFVPWDRIQTLREDLHHLNPNLSTTRMADVDEFIRILMGKALNVTKFIFYTAGTGNYLHQIMFNSKVGNTEENKVQDLQSLFQESMKFQELKLKSIPSPALIIKMSRSNGKLIRDRGILPNLTIDISSSFENGRGQDSVLHLHSVIVLKRCHYTAFVRCGMEVESPWLYFDSMCPEVTPYDHLGNELQFYVDLVQQGYCFTGIPDCAETVWQIASDNHICIYVPAPSVKSRGKEWSTFDSENGSPV